MDACSGNAVNLLDGAADLALKGANARHFLHEGGQAERTDIVEKLITGIGAIRQAALGQKQPCLAGEPNGNLKAGTIGPYLKVQTRFGERNADLVEVAFFKPHIKGLVSGTVHVKRCCKDNGHGQNAHAAQHQKPCLPQRSNILQDLRDLI
ncbi:hypothetical protein D3C78_1103960 [compost metagenome]